MLLKNVLLVNAISSGIAGILVAFKSDLMATIFNTNNTISFIVVGSFLILFSFFVLLTAIKNPIQRRWVKLIIVLDITWVLTSIIVTALLFSTISIAGSVIIIAIAGWVGLMAYLQNKTLQTL